MFTLIKYIPNFLENPNEIFKKLREELEWERKAGNRSEYYCNDYSEPYTYGTREGIRTYNPKPYHPEILKIRKKLEDFLKCKFETCFLNRYLNQKDWLNWHADDSPEMNPDIPICIITLGVERKFKVQEQLKENLDGKIVIKKYGEVFELILEHGSLCIMPAGFQQTHKHCIPKAGFDTANGKIKGVEWHFGERISLTYRGFLRNVGFNELQ